MLRDDRQVALGEVLVACKHAADQYREEAELSDDSELKRNLSELAARREQQVLALEEQIRALGDLPREPDQDWETLSAWLTRMRTHLAPDPSAALLEGAVQSEQTLAERIGEALRQDLPEEARKDLLGLREDVEQTLGRVRADISGEPPS